MNYILVSIFFFFIFSLVKVVIKRTNKKDIKTKIASIELAKALEVEYGEKYKERAEQKKIINDTKPYKFNNGQ